MTADASRILTLAAADARADADRATARFLAASASTAAHAVLASARADLAREVAA